MLGKSLRLAIAKLAGCAVAAAAPNVVVVLTDDQGYGDLSCHGNPHLRTPALDGLRAESTALDRFFVSPTCAPTRAALLTGRHEFAVGGSHTIAGRSLLRPGVPTLPEVLGAAGYATGIFGKWHLGDAFPCRPEDRGFDEVFVHGGGGIGQTPDFWGNGYFDPMIRRRGGWEKTRGYCTDVFFGEAIDWMRERAGTGEPFLLWLATNAPHSPYVPPRGADEPFRKAGLKDPAAPFYAMIENIDANTGRLLAAIDEAGIREETIVVFLTDNGSAVAHWNAGMRGRKGTPHEGGVRVPCFVRWPGKVEAGRGVESPAAHLDLMPTVAAMCGVALPEGWEGEGADLSPALLGKGAFPAGRTFFTHVGRWGGDDNPARFRSRSFSVRDERWRLVGVELFDMLEDPGQTRNVFAAHPEVGQRLLVDYGRWWESVQPRVRQPVRYVVGDERCEVVDLSAHDWWPAREEQAGSQRGVWDQGGLRRLLEDKRVAKTRNPLPGTSGHWKLRVARPGHYRLTLGLLPVEAPAGDRERLARLRAGTAHVRIGRNESRLRVRDGDLEAVAELDLLEGEADLEAWFEGQLEAGRKLGAFYVRVERTGERHFALPDVEVRPVEGDEN